MIYTVLPLSVRTVVSNDDLLNEILLRLPVISIVLFKLVSKRWLSLIKSPTFIRRRSRIPNIDTPSGLFIEHRLDTNVYGLVPLDIRIRSRLENTFKTGACIRSNAIVMQSCNGLFLCYVRPNHKFCIYNPTVNLFKMLPEPHYSEPEHHLFIKMAFDPTKSPYYKVMHATFINDYYPPESYRIQIYSSETGIWSNVYEHSGPFEGLVSAIYCNNAIHWINHGDNGKLHYKLDFVNTAVILTKIQLPVTVKRKRSCKLFESRGSLLLLGMDNTCSHDQLNVYKMGNRDSEWSLKYSVNKRRISLGGVWCIALGEREEDSFMVIELNGKVVLYNFVLKTFRALPEVQLMLSKIRFPLCNIFLLTASFASV
ncbi:granule-bound starch synthase [Tanacetum coccineum]|uniref:Granule-bound starch synthase n=1 Tax=Tanacetum coccineum TaxID=301880 RepID=A0ABQ5E841_9ASTR